MHVSTLIQYVYCRWYLAEYDVDTFEMSGEKLKTLKLDDKSRVWPVEFNGGHRKEIEVPEYCNWP